MGGAIFDTNKLIRQWKRSRRRPLDEYTREDAKAWAEELIRIYRTNLILTPVYLEFVGGVVERHEMELTRAFLNVFVILDEGRIRPEDWSKARQLAERIAPGSRPRGAIDCLIKAIAIRLRCDILTDDSGMPRR